MVDFISPESSRGVADDDDLPDTQETESTVDDDTYDDGSAETMLFHRHLNHVHNESGENVDEVPVEDFFLWWKENYEIRRMFASSNTDKVPHIGEAALDFSKLSRPPVLTPDHITRHGLDIQGINWTQLQASKRDALSLRKWKLQLNTSSSASPTTSTYPLLQPLEDYTFTSFRTTFRPKRGLWQLCNSLAAPSPHTTFYASGTKLFRASPLSPDPVLIFDTAPSTSTARSILDPQIRAISASDDVLISGTYAGDLYLQALSSTPSSSPVKVTLPTPAPINHISTFIPRRSPAPVALISANTPYLTSMSLETMRPVSIYKAPFPDVSVTLEVPFPPLLQPDPMPPPAPNCTAPHPWQPLVLVVGDSPTPVLLDIDRGTHLTSLPAHGREQSEPRPRSLYQSLNSLTSLNSPNPGSPRSPSHPSSPSFSPSIPPTPTLPPDPSSPHVFACAWAPDGIHAATGGQDGRINVFDARNWSKPVARVQSRMGGVRRLEFADPSSSVSSWQAYSKYHSSSTTSGYSTFSRSSCGSGGLRLLCAEEQDAVSILELGAGGVGVGENGEGDGDGNGFRQDWEFLGVVAGATFVQGGDGRFVVGVQDRALGGLMEVEPNWSRERAWCTGLDTGELVF